MKLFVCDFGWSGAIMTFARDEKDARELIFDRYPSLRAEDEEFHKRTDYQKGETRPRPLPPLKCYDIERGTIIETEGE